MTTVELVEPPRPLRAATIETGQIHDFPPAVPAEVAEIIDDLDFEPSGGVIAS